MRPLIEYAVHANVYYRLSLGPLRHVHGSCAIQVATAAYIEPPIYWWNSSSPYSSQATCLIRPTPFSKPDGEIRARMKEPTPVGAAGRDEARCTKGELEIRLWTLGLGRHDVESGKWMAEITCFLDTRTHHGTRPIPDRPSAHQPQACEHLRIISNRRALGVYDIPLSLANSIRSVEALDWHRTHSHRLLLPIIIRTPLLPTFSTPLAARRYTISVRIKIRRRHHGKLWVEAPLQINESGSESGGCELSCSHESSLIGKTGCVSSPSSQV